MKILLMAALAVFITSCGSSVKPINRTDTCVIAYVQNNQWRFNTAIISQKTDRKWVKDSGLDAKMDVVMQIRLQLPTMKADSIMDTVRHSLLRVNPRYDAPLVDSLNHYIHILDTIHTH